MSVPNLVKKYPAVVKFRKPCFAVQGGDGRRKKKKKKEEVKHQARATTIRGTEMNDSFSESPRHGGLPFDIYF
jgi:hypothetical protein